MRPHVILYVDDQRTSAEFYARVLGLAPTLDVPGMTEFALGDGCVLGIMPADGIARLLGAGLPEPARGTSRAKAELYLVVDDARAHHARAVAHGARELAPLAARDWGHEVAYSLDRDGHVLAFAQLPQAARDDTAGGSGPGEVPRDVVAGRLRLRGPELDDVDGCESVLRSLPAWFGLEQPLLAYAQETARLPTFAFVDSGRVVAFLSLREHFARAWEVHCIAVHAEWRGARLGTALLRHAEDWLVARGVELLQVKTLAATRDDPHYAETRAFYERRGFTSLEVFPEPWSSSNPCLQMVKALGRSAPTHPGEWE